MKAFYVVVLVLVAGAVPNHGRTESEGTVFNKTLPRESMNNVTVSSIQLVPYDYLYLAMRWPKSFCNSRPNNQLPCYYQQVPRRFTVHGLWPQYGTYDPPIHRQFVDCTNLNYPRFNSRQLNERLVHDLNNHWPDLTRRIGDNQKFWGYEYNKHGSCTFNDQIRYFRLTLELALNFEDLISRLTGIGGGIEFDRLYSSDEIKGAVYRVTNKWPRLQCVRDGDRFLLMEIRFCVIENRLTNCSRYTDCGNRYVYLPRP